MSTHAMGTFEIESWEEEPYDERSAAWSVVPDSATGELRGLRGEARIINEPDGGHSFTLDYDFE